MGEGHASGSIRSVYFEQMGFIFVAEARRACIANIFEDVVGGGVT
jgi:hypothetical protein